MNNLTEEVPIVEPTRRATEQRYAAMASGDEVLSCSAGLADVVRLLPGQSLLDVGCGRGELLRALGARFPAAGRLVGVDPSLAMLAQAKRGLQNRPVEWVLGEIEALPFADASFDWAVCDCSFNHALQPATAAAELFRVLKPGGCAVLAEPVTLSPLPEAVKQDPQARAACWGGCLTLLELEKRFRDAGFQAVRSRTGRQYQKAGYDFTAALVWAEKGTTK